MPTRQGNNPRRRFVPRDAIDPGLLDRLVDKARYTGSPHHKRSGADYGFHPPANPRPNKSLCDGAGRNPRRAEAQALFREGLKRGMISAPGHDGFPKYVWAVDPEGHAYEAKLGRAPEYHGYALGEDDDAMRRLVVTEWRSRCLKD